MTAAYVTIRPFQSCCCVLFRDEIMVDNWPFSGQISNVVAHFLHVLDQTRLEGNAYLTREVRVHKLQKVGAGGAIEL